MINPIRLIPVILYAGLATQSFAQGTIRASIRHDGLDRTFSYYLPACYTKGKAAPLVFNLHGYSSNADQQEFYGDFRKIADTACFIIVHPNGTLFPQTSQQFWNCGLVPGGGSVDDVGFIHALIDTLSKVYSIDPERIYSTGMSNGGFMSYHLACRSDRFAAVASVTGSMTALTRLECQQASPMPVMEIHGTADSTVKYNGSAGVLSIPEVLDFWIAKNGLNANQVQKTLVPDINLLDGANAELYVYPGAKEVRHYKVIKGAHTWPGAIFPIGVTCMDFNASEVIWQFFSRYTRTITRSEDPGRIHLSVYPNPAGDLLYISSESMEGNERIQCINPFGLQVKEFQLQALQTTLDIRDLPSGLYYLQFAGRNKIFRTGFVKI